MKTTTKAASSELRTWKFAGEEHDLLHVSALCDPQEAAAMSITLTEGIEALCGRLATSTNYNDDPVSIAELLTIGVMAGAANSLLKTVRDRLESKQGGSK